MKQVASQLVQAMPLVSGKINIGSGTYEAGSIIHCESDAALILHFKQGDETYAMVAGQDAAYQGSFTVSSGTVTYS